MEHTEKRGREETAPFSSEKSGRDRPGAPRKSVAFLTKGRYNKTHQNTGPGERPGGGEEARPVHYDVLVVGSGPAGLAAAVAARGRDKSVLVVGNPLAGEPSGPGGADRQLPGAARASPERGC